MALATYADLIDALTNWRGGDTRLTSRYPEWVTLFEAWFNRNHRVRQMEAVATLTQTSGTASVPSDYIAWRSVAVITTGVDRELKWVHPKRVGAGWPAGTGQSEFFTIQNATIITTPFDSSDPNLSFRYWQKVPGLQSNSVNWLMTAYPDIYLNGCLYEAAKTQRDKEAIVVYKGARDEISAEIKAIPHQGEDAVRSEGWENEGDITDEAAGYY